MAEVPLDWSTKVAFCRAQGVAHARWSDDGSVLIDIALGPAPLAARDPADKPAAPKPVNRTDDILRGGSTLKPKARE